MRSAARKTRKGFEGWSEVAPDKTVVAARVGVEILLNDEIDTSAARAIFLKGFEDGWIHL